ncbi:c-type cytochrome [Thauera propionica]|uniref:c-type cytochrome n=1 Tax=Thauera propionica TaxID=2019431 RepID=UPI0023F4BE5D|nr:cytochrome c [Thauera propionica]MDD3675082.1 cytochrome c [Thauera propionica]
MTLKTTIATLAGAVLLGLSWLSGPAQAADTGAPDAAVSPPADATTPVGERGGEELFVLFCRACHAPGPQHPATSKLAITKGADKSVILNREDLPAEYIAHVVRNGLLGMPPLRPTDLTEAELERLVQYVRSTPADKVPAEHPGGAYAHPPTLEQVWLFGIRPRLFTVILPAIVVLAVLIALVRRRKR